MNQNNIGTVWKVFLTPAEERQVIEALEVNELEKNESGLKKFILMLTEPIEIPKNKLAGFVEEHPEVIHLAGNAMNTVGGIIRKKLFGK